MVFKSIISLFNENLYSSEKNQIYIRTGYGSASHGNIPDVGAQGEDDVKQEENQQTGDKG